MNVIKSYIQCSLSNIVNTVSISLQVQLEQFVLIYLRQAYCSTDTLVEVLPTFSKNKP